MIDTVLLCMAWAVFGYALALIEHERSASKERRTRDDPAGRRRDCVGDRNRQPTGDAIPPRAASPAVMNVLSAPVFRLGLRALARGRDSLEFGLYQVAQGSVLLIGNRFEFVGYSKRRHLPPGKLLCMMDGENPLLVDRWPGPG